VPHARGLIDRLSGPSRRPGFRLVTLLFAVPSLALFAQSLRLSFASGAPAEQVSVQLYLTSPHGQEPPSTLQWEIAVPIPQLTLVDQNPSLGPSAQAAGKSVSCRVRNTTATSQTSVCILFGGREPIHDGAIVVFNFKVAADARPGVARVRIDHGLAVRKDLQKTAMAPVEALVRIRRKYPRLMRNDDRVAG
jgi:hypothetical protein